MAALNIWGLIETLARPFEATAALLTSLVPSGTDASASGPGEMRAPSGNDPTAHLLSFMERCDDAVIGMNLAGRITAWNDAAERLYGYCAVEVIDQPIILLIPADRSDEVAATLDRLQRGE